MAKKPKIFFPVWEPVFQGHSGIIYLAKELVRNGIDVDMLARIPKSHMKEANKMPFHIHSNIASWYSKIPKLRYLIFKIYIMFKMLTNRSAIIFHNNEYFKEAVLIKKLRPNLPIIHFCTELLTPEEHPSFRNIKLYETYANIPDLIIDVDKNRAEMRKKRFNIIRDMIVLPNSVPASELPGKSETGGLPALAGGNLPEDMPIMLYSGYAHSLKTMSIDVIIRALKSISYPIFLLVFCYGEYAQDWVELVERELGKSRGRVCKDILRSEILKNMGEADAGIIYYPYSDAKNLNQLYCSPTKVYEYIGSGLPVISSANPTMVDFVEKNGFGFCAEGDTDKDFAKAIDKLFTLPKDQFNNMREREKKLFKEKFCYEKVSGPAIAKIKELIASGVRR